MKPLMSRKVTPENKDDKEWEAADDQLTDAGRDAFLARQRKRMADAEKVRQEQTKIVRPIAINQKRKQG